MGADTRHLLMSVSKSLVSCVVGSLAGTGAIDVGRGIEHYIPGLRGTGYEGATVRDLLDMRSGIGFSEEYLDPASEVRQLDRAIGWAPPIPGGPATLKDFLRSLQREREHGGRFAYRSCETDVLGWLCEEAGGKPFADLASELLWSKIGAENDAYLVQDAAGHRGVRRRHLRHAGRPGQVRGDGQGRRDVADRATRGGPSLGG